MAGLVYVAAFAPDNGQSAFGLSNEYPTTLSNYFVPYVDAQNQIFIRLSTQGVDDVFAPDLPDVQQHVIATVQGPITLAAGNTAITKAAWRYQRNWFVVAANDQTISPDLERKEAKDMGATTIEIQSGHLVLLSHAFQVAEFIERAARNSP